MANHLIIYGHGAGDPGAVGNGTNERDFNRKKLHPFMKKWADKSKDSFVFFDTTGNRDMFQETANGWGMYSISPSYYTTISEYHEDAAGSSATGGHVIVSSSFKADNTDLSMANLIKRIVGLWGGVTNTNGISYRSNLLNLNVAAQRGLNYRLTEIGFITSSRDMSIINKELDQLAKGFIESITGEKLGGTEVAKVKNNRKPHFVVTGDYRKATTASRKVENFLKKEGMKHKVVSDKKDRDKVWFVVGSFGQDSTWKLKLEQFLQDNNYSYVVCLEKQTQMLIDKW